MKKLLLITLILATANIVAMDKKVTQESNQTSSRDSAQSTTRNGRTVTIPATNTQSQSASFSSSQASLTSYAGQASSSTTETKKTKEVKTQQELAQEALVWQKTKEACKPNSVAPDKDINLIAKLIPALKDIRKELLNIIFEYANNIPTLIAHQPSRVAYSRRGLPITQSCFRDARPFWAANLKKLKGTKLREKTHFFSIMYAKIHPQYDYVLALRGSETDDRTFSNIAHLWDFEGNEIAHFAHDSECIGANFNVSGDQIVTASKDGTARIWKLDGTEIARFIHDEKVLRHAGLTEGSNNSSNQLITTACNLFPPGAPMYYVWNILKMPEKYSNNQVALLLLLDAKKQNSIKLSNEEELVLKSFSPSLQKFLMDEYITPQAHAKIRLPQTTDSDTQSSSSKPSAVALGHGGPSRSNYSGQASSSSSSSSASSSSSSSTSSSSSSTSNLSNGTNRNEQPQIDTTVVQKIMKKLHQWAGGE